MTSSQKTSLVGAPYQGPFNAKPGGATMRRNAPNGASRRTCRSTGRRISRRAALGTLAMVCGAGLIGVGVGSVAREASTANSYRRLSQTAAIPQPIDETATSGKDPPATARHDWTSLQAINPATAAWLAVGGTAIDLPVVTTKNEEEQDWYLSHDLWGQPSASGTPFMDWRCKGADGRHVCAYAHHMTSTSGMFSQLQGVYEQGAFDALGTLLWETPDGAAQASPLCALRVDASWQEIQRFDWDAAAVGRDNPGFASWLEDVARQADALSPNATALLRTVTRCFTLVTCSSGFARQRWRTLALWVC